MINYIVALYFGSRMNQQYSYKIAEDPLYFFKKHVEFLENCDPLIINPTFVINGSFPEQIFDYVEKFNMLFRKNDGFSYGAWNDGIINHICNENTCDYFFMIEDDYIPSSHNFYIPFVELSTRETPLVCCKAGKSGDQPIHPQISNGIIRKDVCLEIYDKYSNIFWYSGNSYDFAYHTQVGYIQYLTELGFGITDILDNYSSIFKQSIDNTNIIYGNPYNKPLLIPIEI